MDLSKQIPGFNDPKIQRQIINEIDQFAMSLGFSRDEVSKIKDPRLVLMAYKAMQNSQGHKSGGFIQGPGGPRTDSIPSMLSNGEYVINAKVVKALGKEFFDQLNNSVK